MMQSESVNELSAALAKAQGAMENATYNRQNPHFKNRYADLAAVIDAIRKPLADNGLSYTQTMENGSGAFYLVTTLRHVSGQWVNSMHPLPMTPKPQEFGSALTYARRYSLTALVGIAADEDDDANEAQKAAPEKISEKQIEEIKQALETRGMDMDRLMKWARAAFHGTQVNDVSDIPAAGFKYCLESIRKSGEPR